MAKITQLELKQVLSYDSATGHFTWLVQSGSAKPGHKACVPNAQGYIAIQLQGVKYLAHRLAWLYVHGEWPTAHIDHINGDKTDNSLINLRTATRSANMQNQKKAARNNKSGFMGVHFDKRCKKWLAQIRHSGKNHYLGIFGTPEEANATYLKAKREHHEFCTI